MMAAAHRSGVPLAHMLVGTQCDGAVPAGRIVTGIAMDSRQVVPGGVFVALGGGQAHGLDFLDDALGRGASVVLHDAHDERWSETAAARCRRAGALALGVERLRARAGGIASVFHGSPCEDLDSVIAVTGTDGKTSVTHFIASMLDDGDAPAGVVGTLGHGRPGRLREMGLTTPDAVGVQAALAALVDEGVHRVALEASSHGLDQCRLDGTRIDAAVLTQLGRDHIDYHGSMDAYAAAKSRLFRWPGLRVAVLNADDAFGRRLHEEIGSGVAVVTYGQECGDLRAVDAEFEPRGIRLRLAWDDREAVVRVPLLGRFNVDNLLAAAGSLLGLGFGFDDVVSRLGRIRPVPGRMELFEAPGRPGVVVDYAHTPGALAAALSAVRTHARGRVWCLFGAGGDRDRGKRPLMGRAAAEGADRVVITDDNPRSEDPAAIAGDIAEGIPGARDYEVEHDRGAALRHAVAAAGPGDLILLAGKGHERTQTRGERKLAWDDREAAFEALAPPTREGP